VKLLLERVDINPYLSDSSGQKPLPHATMKGRGAIVTSSNSKTPNRESSEACDPMPGSVTDENASLREVSCPLAAAEPATLNTVDDPPLESSTILSYMGYL